jgi:anti-sigma factor RsiW
MNANTAFRFAEQGPIKVFYWIDGPFGYAISADADEKSLTRVSTEVYRQLATSAGGR